MTLVQFYMPILLLSGLLQKTSAFHGSLPFTNPRIAATGVGSKSILEMSSPSSDDSSDQVPIIITGNNVEVTPALMDYVKKKVSRTLGKLRSNGAAKDCDVHLSVNKNPKVKNNHKAEVVTSLKGITIRCAEESPDMYASVDLVADRLARKLRKYKERRLEGFHGGPNIGENIADVINAIDENIDEEDDSTEEEFLDTYAPKVTKIKSFDLSNSISTEEAIFALDYIDHDFYVYRDSETEELSVVYKRNAGGIGLIQPQKN